MRTVGIDTWPAFAIGHQLSDLHASIARISGADVIALTGEPMEWRMAGEQPVAAIFQMRTERNDGSQSTSYVVARIAGDHVCVAGQAANEDAARRMADGGSGCR